MFIKYSTLLIFITTFAFESIYSMEPDVELAVLNENYLDLEQNNKKELLNKIVEALHSKAEYSNLDNAEDLENLGSRLNEFHKAFKKIEERPALMNAISEDALSSALSFIKDSNVDSISSYIKLIEESRDKLPSEEAIRAEIKDCKRVFASICGIGIFSFLLLLAWMSACLYKTGHICSSSSSSVNDTYSDYNPGNL